MPPVGANSLESMFSYIGVGREIAFGTYVTATAGLDFLSSSLKITQESKILEQIENSRTHSKQVRLGRVIEGEIEAYFYAGSTATNYILAAAMGGSVTSATATGETTGAGVNSAIIHTYNIGDMVSNTYTSLCLNVRKGNSSGAQRFEYSGIRVNEHTFTAEIDEPLKHSTSFMGKDVTSTATDVASVLGVNQFNCLNFSDGRVSVEADSAGAITTTSFWHVQSVEFGITNSLKSDASSRRIGTDTLDVLPPGIATLPLSMVMRFDTSTAYDAMLANTSFAIVLEFLAPTMPSSAIREGLKILYPVVKIADAGDPEIGGPDEMLTANLTFHVMRDDGSATGYAMRAEVTNQIDAFN